MVTTVYLVRHGETEGSEVKRYKGSVDVPLSENGAEQIRRAAVFIRRHLKDAAPSRHLSYLKDVHGDAGGPTDADYGLSAVYCSPLSRALKSAEIIAGPYGLAPIVLPDLRERSFGAWENMTFSEIKEKYPEEFAAWASNPLRFSPVGGENTLEVRDRVVRALDDIMGDHAIAQEGTVPDLPTVGGSPRTKQGGVVESGLSPTSSDIAVVAHGGVNRVILCHIMGVPLENIFRIEQDFAAVNIIEFWDKYPVVKLVNGGPNG